MLRGCSPPSTCYISNIKCHVSDVTYFFLLLLNGKTCCWKVCYQQGLPRLVHLTFPYSIILDFFVQTRDSQNCQKAIPLTSLVMIHYHVKDHHRSSTVINGHQRSSTVINCHQRSSTVINDHQRSSTVINGHQQSLMVINGHQLLSTVLKGHKISH